MAKKNTIKRPVASPRAKAPEYAELLERISGLLEQARRATVRVANGLLAATYWDVGRQIVEFEQAGKEKAEYGEGLLIKLSVDLVKKYGRGFGKSNLFLMRALYLGWGIFQTPSGIFQARVKWAAGASSSDDETGQEPSSKANEQKFRTVSGISRRERLSAQPAILQTASAKLQPIAPEQLPLALSMTTPEFFPLPWSNYVRLMSVKDDFARWFYEDEAIVAGWSVRQLDRMIATQHYERTLLSKNKASMLLKKEHMMVAGEHDPVGLILCSDKSDAVVKYAMGGINAKVFASQYLTSLPDAETLRQELLRTKHAFETRAALKGKEDE